MFPRIDNLIEQWAINYKDISHDSAMGSKKKRFYRFDSLEQAIDITSQFTTFKTPVCGIVTQFDGVSAGRLMELEVIIFAFTKQAVPRSDIKSAELAAVAAKNYGADILNDLWIWLSDQKKEVGTSTTHPNAWLRGLDTDNVSIVSYPVMLNDWWPTMMEMKCSVTRQTCSDVTKYYKVDWK